MQSFELSFLQMVSIAVVVIIISLTAFSFAGKLGKRTLKTYSRGRTASEKVVYMFATFGALIMVIGSVFGIAYLDMFTIPYLDKPYNLDFITENITYVVIFVVVIVLFVSWTLIAAHQRSTNFGEALKQEMRGRKHE